MTSFIVVDLRKRLRRSVHLRVYRVPTSIDRRSSGTSDQEWRRIRLGVQELWWWCTKWYSRSRLWIIRSNDQCLNHTRWKDSWVRSSTWDSDTTLAILSGWQRDVHEPHRFQSVLSSLSLSSSDDVVIVFAWTRGLLHRAKLDDNNQLAAFCTTLEDVGRPSSSQFTPPQWPHISGVYQIDRGGTNDKRPGPSCSWL